MILFWTWKTLDNRVGRQIVEQRSHPTHPPFCMAVASSLDVAITSCHADAVAPHRLTNHTKGIIVDIDDIALLGHLSLSTR
jgi:hypothetical protein